MSTESTKTHSSFEPTEDNIKMMQKQIEISTEEARQLLIKFGGNMFNAICYAMGDTDVASTEATVEEELDIAENHLNPTQKISQFRKILDEKDKIFTKYVKEDKPETNATINEYEYIPFSPTTQKYSKRKQKISQKGFLEFIATPYINEGKLEEFRPITFQDVQKNPQLLSRREGDTNDSTDKKLESAPENETPDTTPGTEALETKSHNELIQPEENNNDTELNDCITEDVMIESVEENPVVPKHKFIKEQLGDFYDEKVDVKAITGAGDKMIKKWRCCQAGLIYRQSNIKTKTNIETLEGKLELSDINVLATKLMIKSNIITPAQYYIGNVIVVNNWF